MPLPTELRKRLCDLTGAEETVSDDQLVVMAADEISNQRTDMEALKEPATKITALSADVAKLTKERDEAAAKVLSLSANAPKQPDPEVMRDRADNYTQRLDLMVDRGDMPKYVADKIKSVVKPTATLMLSASPDLEQKRPIDFVLSLFDGAKLGIQSGNPVPRPATPAPLALSGESGTPDAAASMAEARKEGEKYQQETLRQRGLQPLSA